MTLTYYKSETHSAIPADENKTFINLSQTTTKILFVFKIYSICSNFNLLWLENMVMDLLAVEGIQCDWRYIFPYIENFNSESNMLHAVLRKYVKTASETNALEHCRNC